MMMDSPHQDTGLLGPQAIPVTATEMNSLDAERVLDYFLNASSDGFNGKISSVPPALPTEGQVFVFHLGPDKSLWENNKRKFRYVDTIAIGIAKLYDRNAILYRSFIHVTTMYIVL